MSTIGMILVFVSCVAFVSLYVYAAHDLKVQHLNEEIARLKSKK